MSNPINEISKVYQPDTTYFDDDIIIDQEYYYRVAAVYSADNLSEFSDEIYVYADNITQVVRLFPLLRKILNSMYKEHFVLKGIFIEGERKNYKHIVPNET